MLKRYKNITGKELIKKQLLDFRNDKVRTISFYLNKDYINTKKWKTELCHLKYKDMNNGFIRVEEIFTTKSLNKVNPNAYLNYKRHYLYSISRYILMNRDTIIKGCRGEDLINSIIQTNPIKVKEQNIKYRT